ncbi:MAG: hypothetical protein R3Y61_04670 [Rikenellaceae bacterium]
MDTRNPYKTPEGYFESLNARILRDTIGAQPSVEVTSKEPLSYRTETRGLKFRRTVRSMTGFAAGFAVMVMLAWGGFYLMTSSHSLNTEELYSTDAYLSDVLYGIGSDEFIDAAYGEEEELVNDEYYQEAVAEFIGLYSSMDVEALLSE